MKTVTISAFAAAILLPSAVCAQDSYIPYMDPEGAEIKEITCRIADHGIVYHHGVCLFQASEDGSFTVTTGNAKYSASVFVESDYVAQGMWTGEPYASHMHGPTYEVARSDTDPACWENDVFSVCAW